MAYQLLTRDKIRYIGLVLLNEIIQFQHTFPVVLTGEDVYLDFYLKQLNEKGFLTIKNGKYYATDLGREELVRLYDKYYEYLKFFDVFCAVDLEAGVFAFEEINNPNFTDEDWNNFLADERFTDVRVAVADFKGMDPIEIVFLSFLNENRFDCGVGRWQHDLTGDDVWNEIVEICDTAVSRQYLEADDVLLNVITAGSELALNLIKQAEEDAANQQVQEEVVEEVVEETITEEYVDVVDVPCYGYDYFDPYYDPYYISPIWLVPVLLW
jgi:hypothetical protein